MCSQGALCEFQIRGRLLGDSLTTLGLEIKGILPENLVNFYLVGTGVREFELI